MTVESVSQQLRKTGRYMMTYDLAWGNAGNISARVEEEQYLITASGTYLGELGEGDFAACSFGEENHGGGKKPSKEWPMHQAVYEERPDVHAILHASPFFSTFAACSDMNILSDLFVETMYYLERVERVPYFHPGSRELAEGVREKAGKANILLLENHGVLVYDKSLKEARMGLQTLEMACKMIVTARSAGVELKRLSADTVGDFLENAGYKPRRKWD
ncbi:MAG TPA: class II aldolase/adducin family protein [Bacillales bacterium]|nr:class II aldolase/adducin family protein [Bacillales bacterium]